jgi:hypothetical protein
LKFEATSKAKMSTPSFNQKADPPLKLRIDWWIPSEVSEGIDRHSNEVNDVRLLRDETKIPVGDLSKIPQAARAKLKLIRPTLDQQEMSSSHSIIKSAELW